MLIELHFRFHGSLNDFLPPAKRKVWTVYSCPATSTVKDAIEAVGVPHSEVNGVRVNNVFVSFDYLPHAGDQIDVFPLHVGETLTGILPLILPPPTVPRFVLDVHLGKLARQLRMLGFDSLYENDYADDQIAQISANENRVVLTRDILLLKRNQVRWGYWLRSQHADEQLLEVSKQFGLRDHIQAFYRCIDCNGIIEKVNSEAVIDKVEPLTSNRFTDFYQCVSCKKIYWKGSHYDRMQRSIKQLREKLG